MHLVCGTWSSGALLKGWGGTGCVRETAKGPQAVPQAPGIYSRQEELLGNSEGE